MSTRFAYLLTALLATGMVMAQLAQAAKPEHAGGGGKPAQVEKRVSRTYESTQRTQQREEERLLQRGTNQSEGLKDTDRQRAEKAGQEQKELGRGSEQGQESRETHRRKWWRFWE